MISDGEIEDAKTIIGLMLAAPRIGSPCLNRVTLRCDVRHALACREPESSNANTDKLKHIGQGLHLS